MQILWPERLRKIQEKILITPENTHDRRNLEALEIQIRVVAVENLHSHAFYLGHGGRQAYLDKLETWYQTSFPETEK